MGTTRPAGPRDRAAILRALADGSLGWDGTSTWQRRGQRRVRVARATMDALVAEGLAHLENGSWRAGGGTR